MSGCAERAALLLLFLVSVLVRAWRRVWELFRERDRGCEGVFGDVDERIRGVTGTDGVVDR